MAREKVGAEESGLFIFGYASLIWNPDIEYESKCVGCIGGYVRRLHMASPDHRGTPENLGRVATICRVRHKVFSKDTLDIQSGAAFSLWESEGMEKEESDEEELLDGEIPVVYGLVYKLAGESANEMLEKLAVREIAGYEVAKVRVALEGGEVVDAYTYKGTRCGKYWSPETLDRLASIVSVARGFSGRNSEYVACLINSVRALSPFRDEYLESLAGRIISDEL